MARFRILSIVAVFFCAVSLSAQRCEHVVRRGEDFNSIAQKYGISVEELRASNPSSGLCYVGRRLLIPNPGQVVEKTPSKVEPFDYGLISSLGDSVLTKTTTATYHVGEALWKNGRYSQAMVYLSSAAYGGDARAFYPLADCYSQQCIDDHDDDAAVSWYLKAMEGVQDKKAPGYLMPCLRLAKCYLTGTGVLKDVKQARHFINEYKRYAGQPLSAEARQTLHDIAEEEKAVAKAENARRMAEQKARRQGTLRAEAARSHSEIVSQSDVTATNSAKSVMAQQSVAQTGGSNVAVETWREDIGFGCFVIVERSPGIVSRTRYRTCPNCHGTRLCGGCNGSRRCSLCQGQGGIVTAGYGRYIPCGLCQSTGICNLCSGTGNCLCNIKSQYPGYVIGSSSLILADGTAIRNTAGYNGRDDKFSITPPGGAYTTSDGNSSSGGSSSSRSGSSGTCTKCHGRKYESSVSEYAAASIHGVRQPFHNISGSDCPYCSSSLDHYHYACSHCLGTGRE